MGASMRGPRRGVSTSLVALVLVNANVGYGGLGATIPYDREDLKLVSKCLKKGGIKKSDWKCAKFAKTLATDTRGVCASATIPSTPAASVNAFADCTIHVVKALDGTLMRQSSNTFCENPDDSNPDNSGDDSNPNNSGNTALSDKIPSFR